MAHEPITISIPQAPPVSPKPEVSTEAVDTQEIKIENTLPAELEAEPEVDPKTLIPQDAYRTSPIFYEVAGYFGIDSADYDAAKDQLSIIVDYAIMTGKSNKSEDVLLNIRRLENKLQPPSWGEKRYKNVYRYLRLATQKDSFQKAMSAFERGTI